MCHTRKFGVSTSRNVFQRAAAAAQPTELATPVMLPIPDLRGYSSRRCVCACVFVGEFIPEPKPTDRVNPNQPGGGHWGAIYSTTPKGALEG